MGKILFPKYFPSCPTDGAEYIVPEFTDALTSNIENTMRMFWRPRKIKLFGSYTQFNEDTRLCEIPANYELIIESPYDSEEEMVCEPVKPWTLVSSLNVIDSEDSFYWDSQPFYYVSQEDLFTINSFDFQLEPGEGFTMCNLGVLIKQLYPVEGNGGPYDYQIINILDVPFNIATYVDSETGIGFVGASIEVMEWWSFGGTYNTETGAPL